MGSSSRVYLQRWGQSVGTRLENAGLVQAGEEVTKPQKARNPVGQLSWREAASFSWGRQLDSPSQRESQRNEDPDPPSSHPWPPSRAFHWERSADNMNHRELETMGDQWKRLGRPWRREAGQDPWVMIPDQFHRPQGRWKSPGLGNTWFELVYLLDREEINCYLQKFPVPPKEGGTKSTIFSFLSHGDGHISHVNKNEAQFPRLYFNLLQDRRAPSHLPVFSWRVHLVQNFISINIGSLIEGWRTSLIPSDKKKKNHALF